MAYKKYNFVLRKKEDAELIQAMFNATEIGITKIDWLRKLFTDAGLRKGK